MNQKKVRYFLIGGVAVVWGLIIYRVIDGLSGDDDLPPISLPAPRAAAQAAVNDSFTLIADYPDPFLADEDTVVSVTPLNATQAGVQANNAQAVNQSSFNSTPPPSAPKGYVEGTIQYMGMIANPDKKLKIGTISLQGKEMFVKEKDNVNGYTIMKITPESLEVKYKGKKVVVRRG